MLPKSAYSEYFLMCTESVKASLSEFFFHVQKHPEANCDLRLADYNSDLSEVSQKMSPLAQSVPLKGPSVGHTVFGLGLGAWKRW